MAKSKKNKYSKKYYPLPTPAIAEKAIIAQPDNLPNSCNNYNEPETKHSNWAEIARPEQLEPKGDWCTWLIMAGRGFGKTRTGAETVLEWVLSGRYKRIALIGQSQIEARQIMIDGDSGILQCCDKKIIEKFNRQEGILSFKNGAKLFLFGANNYERLRGPQFDAVWIDEAAKFKNGILMWEQLQMCLRLGTNPKCIVTTTPRKNGLLRQLLQDETCVVTRGTTFDNIANLAKSFLENIKRQYEGTRLEAQEIYAQMLDEDDSALWNRNKITYERPPDDNWRRVVVAVDPAVTDEDYSDETGIVVLGVHSNQKAYVLEDATVKAKPKEWIGEVLRLYTHYKADRVVAEVNKGGELVHDLIRAHNPHVSFKGVRATRGKYVRAEPIASLYEQGKVKHIRTFEKLENQLCTYVPEKTSKSPDRLDALVWGLTDLFLSGEATHQHKIWM